MGPLPVKGLQGVPDESVSRPSPRPPSMLASPPHELHRICIANDAALSTSTVQSCCHTASLSALAERVNELRLGKSHFVRGSRATLACLAVLLLSLSFTATSSSSPTHQDLLILFLSAPPPRIPPSRVEMMTIRSLLAVLVAAAASSAAMPQQLQERSTLATDGKMEHTNFGSVTHW